VQLKIIPMVTPTRILVVDDEEDLCEILQFNLETEGFQVDVAYSAEEALKKDLNHYKLILLDVMMGEISGFKMARILHDNQKTASIPIIFLTAKDTENDKITGFNIGADDYISKPFSLREVIARVKAVLRRSESAQDESDTNKILSFENLEIHLDNKKVFVEGIEVPFTKKEFEILKLLLENRNRVFTREEILSKVWTDEVYVLDRTIDVNITRMRKKIGNYGKNIVTRLGYGYCFEG
jgi:DNA-binding response OmpR family regulator